MKMTIDREAIERQLNMIREMSRVTIARNSAAYDKCFHRIINEVSRTSGAIFIDLNTVMQLPESDRIKLLSILDTVKEVQKKEG